MNRSEIFKAAWVIRKSEGVTMSVALKRAYSEYFLNNMDMGMFDKPAKRNEATGGVNVREIDRCFTQDRAILRAMLSRELGEASWR